MGSTIYSQKLKHPVYISFICEHCGHTNSFSQEIIGNGSAEVNNICGDRYRQEQFGKVGAKAESNLLQNVQRATHLLANGNYAWIKFHKCLACGFSQSWQTGRLWKRSIKFFVMDFILLLILVSWFTGPSPASITPGAWGFFAVAGIFVLIPIIVLIVALQKRDKANTYKPDVRI